MVDRVLGLIQSASFHSAKQAHSFAQNAERKKTIGKLQFENFLIERYEIIWART